MSDKGNKYRNQLVIISKQDLNSQYKDLAKYLFQQEYLQQNDNLPYQAMKQNIIRGFIGQV